MDDLVTWLREQITEDRQVAHAAHSRVEHGTERWYGKDARIVDGVGHLIVTHSWVNEIAHIVRHDPRTVLAQCDAHEAILDLFEYVCDSSNDQRSDEQGVLMSNPVARRRMRDVVRRLGLAYRHRPGYRDEWRWKSA
ncbi:hypothetical protein SAMN05216188_11868 [Lentzea xinjiangensis]|uniref:Uncharacterized protein n=1 Tax=Lentzea xinjiangensis TaxID=402600 RepID=A0A1H9TEG0_9PSEU|nr:hypothetical protein SAMN05216188_11868 [Lentzea xinjiangensis]